MKRISIVTGASSGMGADFAKQLYLMGDSDELWLIARRKDKLNELCENLKNGSTSVVHKTFIKVISLDISGKTGAVSVKELLEKENASSVDGICIQTLVNNAGFGTYGTFENTSAIREMDMIELNCTALTGICSYALPYLKENSTLINVASLAAFMPLGNFAVYSATKAYVLSFTLALAAELYDKKIKVMALCPGSVSTEFANVASNGARKEVLHGVSSEKVVSHCLKKSFAGKHIAIMSWKWKFSALICHFVTRYFGARMTYLFHKRPAKSWT